MSNFRKWLVVVLSVMVTVLCGVAITACNTNTDWRVPKGGLAADTGYVAPSEKTDDHFYHEGENPNDFVNSDSGYVVKTVSLGGMPVSNVTVRVINPGTGITLIEGLTQNGEVRFNIEPGAYKLEYDLPEGYFESEDTVHALSEDNLSVTTVFGSKIIDSAVPGDHLYSLGEVMYDFEVEDADGATRRLSELLNTGAKKAVVINFFFTSCGPCQAEFPALEQAYEIYKNDIEVIALADTGHDSPAAVKAFKSNFQAESAESSTPIRLTFFMAADTISLHNRFGVNSFPTTIIVDRYGVIAASHTGGQPSPEWWKALFLQYTSDDYQQNIQQGPTSGGEEQEPVAPGADIDPLPANNAIKDALLHESMKYNDNYANIEFVGPESERDKKYNWPYHIGQDEDGEKYLTPANVGVNNSWAIIQTELTLEQDETLSIEVNYNTEENGDLVYIIMNRSNENYQLLSGKSGGWRKITLYSSTRRTRVNISISFQKSLEATVEDEFVWLRNLRIEKINFNTNEALDVRTEAASIDESGSVTYKNIYLKDSDGFYHVQVGETQQDNDPILFTDILGASLYSERHLNGFVLNDDSGSTLIHSLYNICYWKFNDYTQTGVFIRLTGDDEKNKKYTDIIIDSFYIQDGSAATVPVTEDVKEVLNAYVDQIAGNGLSFKDTAEKTGNTWLELCHYFRTEGQGDHTAKGHVCRATTNIGAGRTLTYAIELKFAEGAEEGKWDIDTTEATRKNRAGGLFYKFTAPKAGVYSFKSIGERDSNGPDPMILMWEDGADAFNGSIYRENDDSLRVEDALKNPTNNFCLMLYLEEGETICPQLTTQSTEIVGKYEIEIKYEGVSHYELEIATTGGGLWTYDDNNEIYYMAVPTGLNNFDKTYYNIKNGTYCSPMYIDFIHRNYFDANQNSLKAMIDRNLFDLTFGGSSDFTGKMLEYYEKATSKEPDDPTYGMTEATYELVNILCAFTQLEQDSGSNVESGIWKAFACYYNYYGEEPWVDME